MTTINEILAKGEIFGLEKLECDLEEKDRTNDCC